MEENTQLIVVKQLPIIEERLRQVSAEVDRKVNDAKALVCTEDTVKDVKAVRSGLTKEFTALEEQRKSVKNAVLSPYNKFECVYKECVTNKFKAADDDLKRKIGEVENGLKDEKETEIKKYFSELCQAHGLDFVWFKQAEINVTLSATKVSLKKQAKTFVERITDDLEVISAQKYKEEILAEYKPTLELSAAIKRVNGDHERIEAAAEKKRADDEVRAACADAALKAKAEAIAKAPHIAARAAVIAPPIEVAPVTEIAAPIEADEEILRLTFNVSGTRPKLRKLKKFLDEGGYKYE